MSIWKAVMHLNRPKDTDISRLHRTKVDTLALCMVVTFGALYWFYISINSSFWEPDEAIFAYRMTSGNPLFLPFRSIGIAGGLPMINYRLTTPRLKVSTGRWPATSALPAPLDFVPKSNLCHGSSQLTIS